MGLYLASCRSKGMIKGEKKETKKKSKHEN